MTGQKFADPMGYLDEHYHYELEMARWAISQLRYSSQDQWARNACIEIAAIHLRALHDFYSPKSTRKDDALASDFVDANSWSQPDLSAFETLRERINKQIAHLTMARENADKVTVDELTQYMQAIEVADAAFRAALRSSTPSRDQAPPPTTLSTLP